MQLSFFCLFFFILSNIFFRRIIVNTSQNFPQILCGNVTFPVLALEFWSIQFEQENDRHMYADAISYVIRSMDVKKNRIFKF